jgi:hypothetical protein
MCSRPYRIAYLLACIHAGLVASASAEPLRPDSIVLVDTLGTATPDIRFSMFGSSATPFFGLHPYGSKFTGPQFTMERPGVLTSVGGFLNSCETVEGRLDCPSAAGITVQIRPAMENNPEYGPDPERLLASFPLSHDRDPFTYSFESAAVRVPLAAGVYYALFALPPGESGFILNSASSPFQYRALEAVFGDLDPGVGFSFQSRLRGAVRVTAEPVPEPGTLGLVLLCGGVIGARAVQRRRHAVKA